MQKLLIFVLLIYIYIYIVLHSNRNKIYETLTFLINPDFNFENVLGSVKSNQLLPPLFMTVTIPVDI